MLNFSTPRYSVVVDRDRDRNDGFWILYADDQVAHMFLGMRQEGNPDFLIIMPPFLNL